MTVRPYRPGDHDEVVGLFRDMRVPNDPNARVHVLTDERAAVQGAAVWLDARNPDGTPGAASRLAIELLPGRSLQEFYALALACTEDAIARGYSHGTTIIRSAAVLRQIMLDLDIERVDEAGWQPNTRNAVEWVITVDTERVAASLRKAIG